MEELLRGHYYHIYTDYKPDTVLFKGAPDFIAFIHRAELLKKQHNLELLAYCLLPDHYHFIIGADLGEAPGTIKGRGKMHPISNFLYMLHYYYSEHYKNKYKVDNDILGEDFHAVLIDNTEHIKLATCYIHFHPERSGLVKDAKDWKFSSLKTFLDDFEQSEETLIDKHFFYEEEEYERYFKDYLFNKQEKEKAISYLLNT
jgi:REP element-mobilizing transposase RayT